MARVKRGVTSHKRHKKIIKMAKGYRGRNGNVFRVALGKVEKALQYMYRDRRNKKRDLRALWIQRINAASRLDNLSYSQFIGGLIKANVEVNRKMLAEIAVNNPDAFKGYVDISKKHLTVQEAKA